MQTLKLRYKVADKKDSEFLDILGKQYSNMLHIAFNLYKKGLCQKQVEDRLLYMNNLELVKNSFDRRSCAMQAKGIFKSNDALKDEDGKIHSVIFGGKSKFLDLIKGNVTKEEWRDSRKCYTTIGESNKNANRKFQLQSDLKHVLFKHSKEHHILLEISGTYKKYQDLLRRLFVLQEACSISITYTLTKESLNLSFDECLVSDLKSSHVVKDRIFGIDLNPNYVGYSVVDWKSSSDFKIIKSGTMSIKAINDISFSLDRLKNVPSTDHRRVKINNKRSHEIFEICKFLTDECRHYQCEYFSMEKLDMKSEDKKKGNKYNKLVNNNWNRNKFVQNITKRCNTFGIKIQEVAANYSSFVGNTLFRDLHRPDMELASIEIGRRCYEFIHQYIVKDKEQRKNIIVPEIGDFVYRYEKSLEEFGVEGEVFGDLKQLYEFLKNAKRRYRVSLDELCLEFSRCFSYNSKVLKNFSILPVNT